MVVLAQNPTKNSVLAITQPSYGEVVNAGQSYTIRWAPSLAIPVVDILLREGNMADLANEDVIAHGVPNTGEFKWSVPMNLATSVAMSVMVHDSRDPTIANYSPYFTIYGYPQLAGAQLPASLKSSSTQPRHTETIRLIIQEKHPQHATKDSLLVTTELPQNLLKLDRSNSALRETETVNVESRMNANPAISTSAITAVTTTALATDNSYSRKSEGASLTAIQPVSSDGTYMKASITLLSITAGMLFVLLIC